MFQNNMNEVCKSRFLNKLGQKTKTKKQTNWNLLKSIKKECKKMIA